MNNNYKAQATALTIDKLFDAVTCGGLAIFYVWFAYCASRGLGWGLGSVYATMFFAPLLTIYLILRVLRMPGIVCLLVLAGPVYFFGWSQISPARSVKAVPEIAHYIRDNKVMHSVLTRGHSTRFGETADSEEIIGVRQSYRENWSNYYHASLDERFHVVYFDKKWAEFENWFQNNSYPKDGDPPVLPYFDEREIGMIQNRPDWYPTKEDKYKLCARLVKGDGNKRVITNGR